MLTSNNPPEESKAGLRLKEAKGALIALVRASMGHSSISTTNAISIPGLATAQRCIYRCSSYGLE